MEDKKEKRVLNIELSNDVKKISITGKNGKEQVVMRQELTEDDLEMATGGVIRHYNVDCSCTPVKP